VQGHNPLATSWLSPTTGSEIVAARDSLKGLLGNVRHIDVSQNAEDQWSECVAHPTSFDTAHLFPCPGMECLVVAYFGWG